MTPPDVAVEPAGYRVFLPAGTGVGSRLAFVYDDDGPEFGEATVEATAQWRVLAVHVELAGIVGASELWRGAGLGNAVLDLRVVVGGTTRQAFGVRGTIPVAPESGVAWWGTVPAATVPTSGIVLAYELARGPVVLHVHTGLRFRDSLGAFEELDLGFGVAGEKQLLGPLWGVGEVELLLDESPAHLRALARLRPGAGVDFDLGLAMAPIAMANDATLQVVAAVRKRWR